MILDFNKFQNYGKLLTLAKLFSTFDADCENFCIFAVGKQRDDEETCGYIIFVDDFLWHGVRN